MYVALFNLSDEARRMSVSRSAIGTDYTQAKELWSGSAPVVCEGLSAELDAHDACVFLLR